MIFWPRDSRRTVATTEAPDTVGAPTFGESLPPIIRTSLNVTLSLSAEPRTSRSTRRSSPSATRYCFPPERMMAYTKPPKNGTRLVPQESGHDKTSWIKHLFRLESSRRSPQCPLPLAGEGGAERRVRAPLIRPPATFSPHAGRRLCNRL